MPSKRDKTKDSKPDISLERTGQEWERVGDKSRDVDECLVLELLRERWNAKQVKEYETADRKANILQKMRISYHDEAFTWQTLPLISSKGPTDTTPLERRKRSKKQVRNRRQAEKNRKKQSGLRENNSASDEQDDSITEDAPKKKSRIDHT